MPPKRAKHQPAVHQLAWEAFRAATDVAKRQGLYGAGQDLLKDAFSGNVRGLGPGSAEVEFDERPNEALMILTADKTEPGAFNLPIDRKSTRLNSSHVAISYAVFCLKKKINKPINNTNDYTTTTYI